MANKHGLTANIVRKQNAARKLGKARKIAARVYIGGENFDTRYALGYKKRKRYLANKNSFPKLHVPHKDPIRLYNLGLIDHRGFFVKGKKRNYLTRCMVDANGLDFWGLPRNERPRRYEVPEGWDRIVASAELR